MNQPHESQAAAMARAGELSDGEQLRECTCHPDDNPPVPCAKKYALAECIASGQVSAAQVVAHAGAAEVTTGWPAGLLQDDSRQLSKALSRDPNARAHARESVAPAREAVELPELPSNVAYVMRRIRACENEVPAQLVLEHAMRAYALAYTAAQQEEVDRLRKAVSGLLRTIDEPAITATGMDRELRLIGYARAALTTPQGAQQAEGAEPVAVKPLDDLLLQQVFGDCIEGALAFGFQGTHPPPEGHWLWRFWNIGRAEAQGEREPLTRDEVFDLPCGINDGSQLWLLGFARAIEAAHGIGTAQSGEQP